MPPRRASACPTPAAALSAELVALVALIERQQAQLLERTEAAAMWQARAQVLDERVKMLEAPKPDPEPAPPAAESVRRRTRPQLVPIARALAALALVLLAAAAWVR